MINKYFHYIMLSGLIILTLAPSAQASNEGRRYVLEMVVFSYETNSTGVAESWPTDLQIELPDRYLGLHRKSSFNKSQLSKMQPANENDMGQLPLSRQQIDMLQQGYLPEYFLRSSRLYTLGSKKRRLENQDDIRILFHEAWQMPVYGKNRNRTLPIRIQGGKRVNNRYELDGTITVSVARYLHIDTNLFLSKFQSAEGEQILNQVIPMQQSRRMRSKELHYIDHPKFGILIYFTPFPEG